MGLKQRIEKIDEYVSTGIMRGKILVELDKTTAEIKKMPRHCYMMRDDILKALDSRRGSK